MTLPDGFLFSQSNLQDFVDCQRRFQLRHLLHLAWPAVEAEPYLENELRIDLGAQFHKIARQYLVGIPQAEISKTIVDNDIMLSWWNNFLDSIKNGSLQSLFAQGTRHYEELIMSVPVDRFRLIAKYDLLIIQPGGQVLIIDWKTTENHPKRKWLADRLQTHVYPYVATGALPGLINGQQVEPSHIEMIYWFTNQPDQPERFSYDQNAYQDDHRSLTSLITTIDQKSEPVFPLTADERRCLFCTYRSLCNRGVKPGDVTRLEEIQDAPSAEDVLLDIDQIGEIEL